MVGCVEGWAQLVRKGKYHFYPSGDQWSLCLMPRPTDHLDFQRRDFIDDKQVCKFCEKKIRKLGKEGT